MNDDRIVSGSEVTPELLERFADAWNRHDVDALMTFMTDDCVFETSAGPDGLRHAPCRPRGGCDRASRRSSRHSRRALGHARHLVNGDRGFSQWTFTGTRANGDRVEVHGCDLFTFRDGQDRREGLVPQEPSAGGRALTPFAGACVAPVPMHHVRAFIERDRAALDALYRSCRQEAHWLPAAAKDRSDFSQRH
jgi:ketosteroid isomerase-like protein